MQRDVATCDKPPSRCSWIHSNDSISKHKTNAFPDQIVLANIVEDLEIKVLYGSHDQTGTHDPAMY